MVSCALFTQNVMVMIAFAMLANGLTIPGLSKTGDGFLKLDFDVKRSEIPANATASEFFKTHSVSRDENHFNQKRSGIVPNTITNGILSYLIPFELGSDKQPLGASIDTGSSDLWVPAPDANCTTCKSKGTFDPATSTTFKDTGKLFNITYGDNSSTIGTLGIDTINIGGVTLDNLEFAVANKSSVNFDGVLGVSFPGQEGMARKEGAYVNFPALLKQEGLIAKNAYSLYLNELTANTGSIIFGGIDHAKYNGTLATSPIALLPYQSIAYHGIKKADGTTIPPSGKPVLFDSGTSTAALPAATIAEIYSELGAIPYGNGLSKAPCDQGGKNFVWDFGDGTVSMPYTSFLLAGIPIDLLGNCVVWPILASEHFPVEILGDIFLRNAYVVFDLEDKTISYGDVVFTDETDIQPL